MKREITDYENHGCTDDEIKLLLFWFGELMSSIAGTAAYCAWYNLADLALVKHSPNHQIVSEFDFEIWRVYEDEKRFWSGTFTNGDKKLIVDGCLVKD